MNLIKTSWFWWWGWSPEKMEKWLENLESEGWNLFQVDFSGIRFKFKKDIPESIRYSVDYQTEIDDDYISIFQEDGWELSWSGGGGWYLWRKAYTDIRPEMFTDHRSLIDRNNRMTRVLAPLFIMIVVIFILLLLLNRRIYTPLIIIYTLIITLYSFIFYQILKFNKKLKSSLKE